MYKSYIRIQTKYYIHVLNVLGRHDCVRKTFS